MKELHAEDAQVVEAIDGSCATDTPQSGLAEVLECQEVSVRVSLEGLHVQEVYNTHFRFHTKPNACHFQLPRGNERVKVQKWSQ